MSLVPRSRFKRESGSLSRRTFLTASVAIGGGLLLTLKLPLSAWGAASGAGAGGAVQVLTKGQRVRIPAETRLSFTLQNPVRI